MKFPFVILFMILGFLLGLHVSGRVFAADVPFTYTGKVVSVADGDTLTVSIEGWPAPFNPIEVRVAGIDTPESRKQDAACIKELRLGLIAKSRARKLLLINSTVTLEWTGKREKYGRLLARVILPDNGDFGTLQVREGIARRYDGGSKPNWCK